MSKAHELNIIQAVAGSQDKLRLANGLDGCGEPWIIKPRLRLFEQCQQALHSGFLAEPARQQGKRSVRLEVGHR